MENLELYKEIISLCSEIELKGKNMLYTSNNGHMFSQLNKAGEIGMRFSEKRKEELLEELNTTPFTSYGSIMKGYVKIPETYLSNISELAYLLQESHKYVLSLEPK